MLGNGLGPICEVGTAIPGSTLYKGKGKFLDIDGLSNLEGESVGAGPRILLMYLENAALAED